MDRHEIASALEEIGTLLELLGENPFKARAYHQGARSLEQLDEDLGVLIASGRLGDRPGFGKALVEKISALHRDGRLPYLEELRAQVPAGLLELLSVPGLGPKKVKALHDGLGISSLGELEYACHENRLVGLPGFGEKSQAKILAGAQFLKRNRERRLYSEALPLGLEVERLVRKAPGVTAVELAGSLRRRRETIGDVDVVAAAPDGEAVGRVLVEAPKVAEVLGHGPTKTSVRFENGLACDLRVVEAGQFGAALLYFTGSKDWNIALRSRARALGFSLNEYGLFRLDDEGGKALVESADERSLLSALGVPWVEPELREDPASLEAALAGRLPRLVEEGDIRGVLHAHTTWSDGADTIEAMVLAAEAQGLEYLGISDHSQTAAYARGLKPEALARQREEMDEVAARHPRVRLLRGIESDILPDGALDYPDRELARFDFVIASVHSSFSMTPEAMTRRLVRAVSHPATRILGHPTGRLLLAREGYRFDLDAVLAACAEHGVALELNAHPHRLDLDWRELRHAVRHGVLVAIDPDSHRKEDLGDWRYGVGIARKGWLEAKNVLNTRGADAVSRWLARDSA